MPKAFNDVTHAETISPSKIVHSKWRRRKRSITHEKYDTFEEPPFRVRVRAERYKRDSDVTGKMLMNN